MFNEIKKDYWKLRQHHGPFGSVFIIVMTALIAMLISALPLFAIYGLALLMAWVFTGNTELTFLQNILVGMAYFVVMRIAFPPRKTK